MDEYNNEGLGYLFIILGIFSLFIGIFLYNYYNLYKFKKCYDINFQDNKCIKYLDY